MEEEEGSHTAQQYIDQIVSLSQGEQLHSLS